jgi:hypothetical protein
LEVEEDLSIPFQPRFFPLCLGPSVEFGVRGLAWPFFFH